MFPRIFCFLVSLFMFACWVAQLCLALCNLMDNCPGKNTRVDCHSLLQGIFPIQGSNPGLLHCRQIRYHLSHQGIPFTCSHYIQVNEMVKRWACQNTNIYHLSLIPFSLQTIGFILKFPLFMLGCHSWIFLSILLLTLCCKLKFTPRGYKSGKEVGSRVQNPFSSCCQPKDHKLLIGEILC